MFYKFPLTAQITWAVLVHQKAWFGTYLGFSMTVAYDVVGTLHSSKINKKNLKIIICF